MESTIESFADFYLKERKRQHIFEKIIADGYEQLLAITISSGLSGTFNSVRRIAQDFP